MTKTKKLENQLICRFCGHVLKYVFADLGETPISNANLLPSDLNKPEVCYPLKVFVCEKCLLVQLPEHESNENIFNDQYAYFSSYSDSWLKHAEKYVNYITERLKLNSKSQVVEIASNDGYLLQYFLPKKISVLGIDPTKNTAKVAEEKGIKTITEFFGVKLARELKRKNIKADLIIGNNVLAHTPFLNDLVGGIKILLAKDGVVTMEFPHLLQLIINNQFDTIYHEHYSYFSFLAVRKIFAQHGLTLFDVEELPTHGGSLRIFAKHVDNINLKTSKNVLMLLKKEKNAGLDKVKTYEKFQENIIKTKFGLLKFLLKQKANGKNIVGYGAPAKGNTFLNYCGVRTDFIDYTVDRSPHKQNHYLPGTKIPIYDPEKFKETKPDFIFILPWNIKEEVMETMAHVKKWGCRFFVAIPEVKLYD